MRTHRPATGERESLPWVAGCVVVIFVATWALWLPVVTGRGPAGLRSALWLAGVFVPALTAIAFTLAEGGLAGVRVLLRPIAQWEVRGRWYVFALLFMVATKLVVALVHRAVLGAWPQFGGEGIVVMAAGTLISTPVQAGEEVGWRGYLLPRLGRRVGFGPASVSLGAIWALWHIPQFFLSGADTYRQSFPLWGLEVVAISVAITWLYAAM